MQHKRGRESQVKLGTQTKGSRDFTVKVRTERHGGGDISSRVTFQGAKVRKPLLAVSGLIAKGNIVVFRWKWILHIAEVRVLGWHL